MKRKFLVSFVLAGMFLTACNQGVMVVNPPAGEVTNVSLISELSLNVGETKQLVAGYNSASSRVQPRWISSDATGEIISLRADGGTCYVTGIGNGVANVTVMLGSAASASCVVTVGGSGGGDQPEPQVTVTSVTLSETSKQFTYTAGGNNTFTLSATVTTSNNSAFAATWSSTNETVARVTPHGNNQALVTVLGAGETDIVATAQDKNAHCRLSVTASGEQSELSISLSKSSTSLKVGASEQLVATVTGATSVSWQSSNPSVAEVNSNGLVTAKAQGSADITASVSDESGTKTAVCRVTVTQSGGGDDPQPDPEYTWSQPGHLYLHYKRDKGDYDPWAVWIWANAPVHYEGSLWGASAAYDHKGITPASFGWMTKAQTGGTGTEVFEDANGIICDIDLTANIVDGRLGEPAPIVEWQYLSKKTQIGFLIVDQSKMDGTTMWTSDGGAEAYIKKLNELMPKGAENYLHVYCVEGSVQTPHYQSGVPVEQNPTLNDTTGQYRSAIDESIIRKDNWTSGVNTSTTFLEDTPGTGYQIFVPSFKDSDGDGLGDLRGIIDSLDYLDDLGVKVLWLTPIQESNSYHGYDITDYYKIDEKFGTLQDYSELLYKAHAKGMKVLMDMVINHTSKSNVLYQKSQRAAVETINGKEIHYRDMYLWKYADETKQDKIREWDGIEASKENPYGPTNPANFTTINVNQSDDWYRDGTSNYYYFGKFGSGMAELNYSCQATRDYMTDMCKYWLSFGLDGFRLDAIKHIYLMSELDPAMNLGSDYITYDVGYRTYWHTELDKEVRVKNDYTYDRDLNVIFWKQFAGTLKSAYPGCFLVGENFDGWNERIAPFYESMDSQFDFSTYFHLNESTVNGGITAMGGDIQATLGYNKGYRQDQINGPFTSNHDLYRMVNHAAANSVSTHHAEVNASNKDFAMNRARWFAAVTLLSPGLSWIYYGDELGMTGNLQNGEDAIDHGNNVDRWYRQPMKWGNTIKQDGVTGYNVAGSALKWDAMNQVLPTVSQQQADQNSMYNFFKQLNKAKNDSRYPAYGSFDWTGTEGGNTDTLVFQMSDSKNRKVIVCINGGGTPSGYSMGHNQGTLIAASPNSSKDSLGAYGFAVFTA